MDENNLEERLNTRTSSFSSISSIFSNKRDNDIKQIILKIDEEIKKN